MGVERELKFALAPAVAQTLAQQPLLLLAGPPRRERLRTSYFDTGQLELGAAGFVLRVREAAGSHVVTVKTRGDDMLGSERGEWEWRALDSSVSAGLGARDLRHALRHTALGSLGWEVRALRERLAPRFGTCFERDAWQLEWDGARIELALDRGVCQAVRADGTAATTPLCELELEVLEGGLDAAWDLAWTLAQDLPLRLSPVDKARRAAALLAGRRPRAPAEPGSLARQATLRQAMHDWLQTACAQLSVGAERIASADDERDVHQFRVTLRRLRTALRWLGPHLPDGAADWLRAELRWTHQLAGLVRDADVGMQLLRQVPSIDTDAAAQAAVLLQRIDAARGAHRDALCAYLLGPRFGRLLLALGRCGACAAHGAQGAGALRRLAERALRRDAKSWQARLQACAQALREAAQGYPPQPGQVAVLHALRIDSKRLRLSAERMAGLLARRAGSRFARAGKAAASLQTELGEWHDCERLLQGLAEAREEMPQLRAWLERSALAALQRAAHGVPADPARARPGLT